MRKNGTHHISIQTDVEIVRCRLKAARTDCEVRYGGEMRARKLGLDPITSLGQSADIGGA
jgi:hypothetical protein